MRRIGAASEGWRRLTQWSNEQDKWCLHKQPRCSPDTTASWFAVTIALGVALGIHHVLVAAHLPLERPSGVQLLDFIAGAAQDILLLAVENVGHEDQERTKNHDESTSNETHVMFMARRQAATDQAKALLHFGLIITGFASMGTKLLIGCSEATATRMAAKRGALFRPISSGCSFQRIAEVDTVLLAHTDAANAQDATRVLILGSMNPPSSGASKKLAHTTNAPATKTSPRVLSSKDSTAVFRLTSMHGLDVKVFQDTDLAAMTRILGDLGLPADEQLVVADTASRISRDELNEMTGSSTPDLPSPAIDTYVGFVAAKKNEGVQNGSSPNPIAVGCALVRRIQRSHGRRVLVIADDAQDGHTAPLLLSADVGVVAGDRFMTGKKQKSPSEMQRFKDAAKKKQAGNSTETHEARSASTQRDADLVFYGSDVALASGLPGGMSPLADLMTLAQACCRAQHGAQFGRVANIATCTAVLALQVGARCR